MLYQEEDIVGLKSIQFLKCFPGDVNAEIISRDDKNGNANDRKNYQHHVGYVFSLFQKSGNKKVEIKVYAGRLKDDVKRKLEQVGRV